MAPGKTRIIAVYNQKGGVGKTTTAVNLAAALGLGGRQALLLDLDPQASATRWLLGQPPESRLLYVFTGQESLFRLVQRAPVAGVSLIPASIGLSQAQFLHQNDGAGTLRLGQELRQLPALWDFVLLDCPPSLGFLSLSGLAAADEALLPVEESPLALEVVEQQERILAGVRASLNPKLAALGFVLNRVGGSRARQEEARARLTERTRLPVLAASIRESRVVVRAARARQTVQQVSPRSLVSRDFQRLARCLEGLPD